MDFIREDLIDNYIRSILMGISEEDIWWNGFRYKLEEKNGISHLCLYDFDDKVIKNFYDNKCIYIPEVFSLLSSKLHHFFSRFEAVFDFIADGLILIPNCLFEFSKVRNVSLKSCIEIGDNAFAKTNYLNKVYIPSVDWISSYAFWDSELKEIDLSNVSFIDKYAFLSCYETKFNSYFPRLNTLMHNAFESSGIEEMIAPDLMIVEDSSFLCSKLKRFVGDSVSVVGKCAFMGSKLEEVRIDNVTEIYLRGFANTLITSFKAEKCNYVHVTVFDRCYKLKDLYLPLIDKKLSI